MSIFPTKRENQAFPVEGDGTLNEIFRNLPVSSFPKPASGTVVALNSDTPVAEACRILSKNNILSAPVRDVKVPDTAAWVDKYTGVADFLAIVDWMMQKTWGHAPASLDELLSLRGAFASTPISEVADHARWSRFVPIDPEQNTFLDVMLILGKYGCHRVWTVKSPGGDITNVITQSGLVDQLGNNLASFGTLPQRTIKQLGLCDLASKVVTVTKHDTFWDAFRKISQKVVSAVPVVDDEGRIVANISAHDIRAMILDPVKFRTMCHAIGDYADMHRDIFTCRPSDTLEQVIRKFQGSHVHRLYVVDEEHRPFAVISLRDVVAQFVREPDDDTIRQYFQA